MFTVQWEFSAILFDDDDVKGSDLSCPTGIKIKRTAGVWNIELHNAASVQRLKFCLVQNKEACKNYEELWIGDNDFEIRPSWSC